ncbi:MAG: EipA family protein, partial [Paucibacter sp.]|nr:EipA family protein [Roseateles sp.]
STTEGLARVIEKAFKEQGRPNAYVKGEEVSAALSVGLRYGEGRLQMKAGASAPVFWAGPSIGFDAGANASKVFTLVYHLPKASAIYQRFPGVDGSLYYVGGAGINYQRLKGITLAPIRLGVGLRAGASVGYVHYRREKSINPF